LKSLIKFQFLRFHLTTPREKTQEPRAWLHPLSRCSKRIFVMAKPVAMGALRIFDEARPL